MHTSDDIIKNSARNVSYGKTYHRAKSLVTQLLDEAEIIINGPNPWDIQVHNNDFYSMLLQKNALGLGETYMANWWDCEALDTFCEKILRAKLDRKIRHSFWLSLQILSYKLFNHHSPKQSLQVVKYHYDLGNEFFEAMLDKKMNYSCAYWPNANNLEQAQRNKLHLSCQKLNLAENMTLLDVGCGWGALASHAAENYPIKVDAITISKNQLEWSKSHYPHLPINFEFKDYRDLHSQYDRIVSIGMFEHVGYKNYKTYMKTIHRCLKEDGLFLLHTIGSPEHALEVNSWIEKYIFPNGQIPPLRCIVNAAQNLFTMEDWHNFGSDYDKTLMAWHQNFEKNWPLFKNNYPQKFYRMWRYYLLTCAGAFRARNIHLWQIVFSKNGLTGGYHAAR